MNETNATRLREIFRTVFQLPPTAEVGALDQANTPAWDSLAHVQLVTAIESEFDVSLDAVDQLQMVSYSETARVLQERGF